MGGSLRKIALAGILVVAAYLGYRYLLPPEVKDSLKNAAQKGVQFGLDMHDKVTGNSEAEEKERILTNQKFVADQWKQAGF